MTEYIIFELGCSNSEKRVKIRGKQQAYTHVVRSTWNQALSRSRKQGRSGTRVMTSPEVIFTICRRTTASPYNILKSLIIKLRWPKEKIFTFQKFGFFKI